MNTVMICVVSESKGVMGDCVRTTNRFNTVNTPLARKRIFNKMMENALFGEHTAGYDQYEVFEVDEYSGARKRTI